MSSITRDPGGCEIVIAKSAPILDDCHIGDSIAVNGACLTVTEFDKVQQDGWFKVWLANETLECTDLGESRRKWVFAQMSENDKPACCKVSAKSETRLISSARWLPMCALEGTLFRYA